MPKPNVDQLIQLQMIPVSGLGANLPVTGVRRGPSSKDVIPTTLLLKSKIFLEWFFI